MNLLNEVELTKVSGGISVAVVIGIGAIIVFVIGILDGFVNPNSCN